MPELTREEKIKIFEKLPKELQNLMQSEDTGAFLLYLGKKYSLANDKIHQLSKLVGDIVLGITPITSLAQEINLKIATDPQIAMNLTQELYTDLLSPVMSKTSTPPQASIGASMPQMPAMPSKQTPQPVIPPTASPVSPIQAPSSKLQVQSTDRYREPINGVPGIVDLRKMPLSPPAVSRVEPLPIVKIEPPVMSQVEPPPSPLRPLTFTKPIEPIKPKPATPLIEAEPHRQQQPPVPPAEKPMTNLSKPPIVEQVKPPVIGGVEPQYIIRPPGLAPTDLPRNILDLKKDKGEF